MAVRVRLAQQKDIKSLDQLYFELNPKRESSAHIISETLGSPTHYLFVAEELSDDKNSAYIILGSACFVEIIMPSRGREGYINDLIVNKAARRRGIGKLLFCEVEKEAHRRGCSRIKFTCGPTRKEANFFHKALGYKLRATAHGHNGTNLYEKKID